MIRIIVFCLITTLAYSQEQVNWIDQKELQNINLKENRKKILFFFTADWCVYCRKMKSVAFKNQDVVKRINEDFAAIKMNVHTTDTITLGQRKFVNKNFDKKRQPIHGLALQLAQRSEDEFNLPFLVILNPDLSIRKRVFTYLSPQDLLLFLNQ